MYINISILILTPILVILWIYILITVKTTQNSNTSIELNIINTKKIVPRITFTANQSVVQKKQIKFHVPKFMLELYERNKVGGKNFASPDVVRSLIPKHAESLSDNRAILEEFADNHLLIFDLPSSDSDELFVGAELKILTIVEDNTVFGVQRKVKLSVYDDVNKKLFDLKEIHVHHSNNTWLSFNLTQPVVEILDKNLTEKYLKIIITTTEYLPNVQNNFKLSLMPITEDFEHDYPILLLSYTSKTTYKQLRRTRRSLEDDYEEETNRLWDDEPKTRAQLKKIKKIRNTCRRKPLYINFAEIEYDLWIVQPSGYEAYQCQGRCFYPVAEHLNPTKHAIVQALVHSVAPSRATRSCCVPTHLDSISILYVDEKGVLTYRFAYKDMVVLECGCR